MPGQKHHELSRAYGMDVYVDDRVPLWWNGGLALIPAGVDPDLFLAVLSGDWGGILTRGTFPC